MKKFLTLITFLLFLSGQVFAQIDRPVTWDVKLSNEKPNIGDQIDLIISADIQEEWYLYSSDFDPALGPVVTSLKLAPSTNYELVGKLKPMHPKKKHDDVWDGDITYFTSHGEFKQTIKVKGESFALKGTIDAQSCNDKLGRCVQVGQDFTINIQTKVSLKKASAIQIDSVSNPKDAVSQNNTPTIPDTNTVIANTQITEPATSDMPVAETGLITFMLIAFGAGLVALLTPCVFPMIPMTVSYFTKVGKTRGEGVRLALLYGFSIVFIYTVIGFIVAKLAGAEVANWLSTHWIPNLLFFVIFILFALSFLGMFDIVLPNSWINKADIQADRGGYIGVFFMALTLVLVSFSCTGPIVGSLLVKAANGEVLRPVAGMFAFSLAFSIPFTLFAIFPSWLNSIPRSGGWLNTVKVSLGFIELALAFKFLSQADLAYHWGLLNRDTFLIIHTVVFTIFGFYLLGVVKLEKDPESSGISVIRLLLSTLVLIASLYLFTGLLGNPLKALSGYLPPANTEHWTTGSASKDGQLGNQCETPRFGDKLKMAKGIEGYFDYKQALACAKKLNKPLFIDFTGHGCANCRRMEENVFSDERVLKMFDEDYVVVSLYVDDKTELPQSEWYTSSYDSKQKSTIGDQNADLQISKFNVNAQPYYVVLDPNTEKPLTKENMAFELDSAIFLKFLKSGISAFSSK